jgi:hypothetical protein
MAPLYPRCPYGCRRMTKSGTTYKPTCKKCAVGKKNGRTRRHSRRRRRREEDGVAESSQQQGTAAGTSANTLRRSSGDIISPRPNHPGRAPRGRTWNGREHQPDHPNAPQNVARRTQHGACRGISRLQAHWQTDFPWMHCERDTALMAATGGRCVTTPSATDCEECVGCHQCSRMYCKHCRSRTGNTFRADIGCRTFKRDELARHERTIFHPNKVGSSSVQPMLSNEAQRAKQTRIRTILAEFLAAVERSGVSVLGFLLSCRGPPMGSVRLGWAGCGVGRSLRGRRGGGKERRKRASSAPLFSAKSRGYSAFQYILPDLTPRTNRCASRFATTASALRASTAEPGRRGGLKLRNLP